MISSTNSIKIIRMTKIPKKSDTVGQFEVQKGENDPEKIWFGYFVVKL